MRFTSLLARIALSCACGALAGFAFAQAGNTNNNMRRAYDNAKPLDVVNDIVQNDDTNVIETKLDQVDNNLGQFPDPSLKISNTFDSVRQNLDNYLQRFVFIALTAGVVLIIYNGFILVTSPLSEEGAQKVRKRLLYLSV
jgi:hypothetical protein